MSSECVRTLLPSSVSARYTRGGAPHLHLLAFARVTRRREHSKLSTESMSARCERVGLLALQLYSALGHCLLAQHLARRRDERLAPLLPRQAQAAHTLAVPPVTAHPPEPVLDVVGADVRQLERHAREEQLLRTAAEFALELREDCARAIVPAASAPPDATTAAGTDAAAAAAAGVGRERASRVHLAISSGLRQRRIRQWRIRARRQRREMTRGRTRLDLGAARREDLGRSRANLGAAYRRCLGARRVDHVCKLRAQGVELEGVRRLLFLNLSAEDLPQRQWLARKQRQLAISVCALGTCSSFLSPSL